MEEKKQGVFDTYKCLGLFAVMIVVAVVIALVKPSPDVYTASASGFNGAVTVQVSVLDGKIVSVVVTEQKETPEVAGRAIEQLPADIVARQNVDVDMVSGATYASRAILTATADCMKQAGLSPAAIAEPETEGSTVPTDFGPLKAGTYTAAAKGYNQDADVTVTVTVDGAGTITEVQIDASGETPAIGGADAEVLQAAILEAQGTNVDATTSGSMTRNAILEALAQCLTEAGGN